MNKLVLAAILGLVFWGCTTSDDEDSASETETVSTALQGSWNLSQVTCNGSAESLSGFSIGLTFSTSLNSHTETAATLSTSCAALYSVGSVSDDGSTLSWTVAANPTSCVDIFTGEASNSYVVDSCSVSPVTCDSTSTSGTATTYSGTYDTSTSGQFTLTFTEDGTGPCTDGDTTVMTFVEDTE